MTNVFDFLKRKDRPAAVRPPVQEYPGRQEIPAGAVREEVIRPVDFSCPVGSEERDLVGAAAGAILAGDAADSVFRIKSVTGIDSDKEAAAAVVAAVISAERSNTLFRLKSITELQQKV